jgi:hypothetical protein
VILSNDGVQECRSSFRSLNVVALRFMGCDLVYPITISRPELGEADEKKKKGKKKEREVEVNKKRMKRFKLSNYVLLSPILRQLLEESLYLDHVSADAPKRAELR